MSLSDVVLYLSEFIDALVYATSPKRQNPILIQFDLGEFIVIH